MLTRKQVKKLVISSIASFVVVAGIPLSTSHAAGKNDPFESIFAKFGWEYTNGNVITQPDNSQNYEISKPTIPASESPTTSKPKQPAQTSEQSNTLADRIIKTGEKYLGTPYKFGAPSGQTKLFDCSLFVKQVFKENGISLPRTSRQQAKVGKTVSRSELKKGDLVFFSTKSSGGRIAHVGIYAGNNRILHTWGPGGVRYDSLSTRWLDQGYVTAKRVIN
ncbi:C40 family peptidase [Thermoflavimicrobium dichotomicum]|uniref:NlpC/P60 family protein n=1 Tax=Thermoflavimicrobium dichotomicum TaxID=46223 RepID=A0A1I3LFC1_9BACL|nr:C40 family peptidase [Thermoflavimicrobium dichotomicum]SFI83166.1 NlpC/P60 family protein [Thermoflavimicrobium dichotomicum]